VEKVALKPVSDVSLRSFFSLCIQS